ncbi:hypothetical protein ABZ605_28335 [Streptomyces sp. NPDC012765]
MENTKPAREQQPDALRLAFIHFLTGLMICAAILLHALIVVSR